MSVDKKGELDFMNSAFIVLEVILGNDGTAQITPLTANNGKGNECICLFSESLFAERAVEAWKTVGRNGNIIPLESPEAIINSLSQTAIPLGIKHVIIDYQQGTERNALLCTVEEVLDSCRQAVRRRS